VADIRGRPFAYVALTLSAWVGVRFLVSGGSDVPDVKAAWSERAPPAFSNTAPPIRNAVTLSDVRQEFSEKRLLQLSRAYPNLTHFGLTTAQDPWQNGGRPSGLLAPLRVAKDSNPQSAGRDTPPSNALALTGEAGPPEQTQQSRARWGGDVYAYSFWRLSTGNRSTLAPGAQYGGSQSGIIATIDPFGASDRGLRLLARASATPDGEEREAALGLRWRPANSWPLSVSAERRFRANAPDRFAAYLAGGVDAVPISGLWSLSTFGQAGYATGKSGGGFFDAQARVMRSLATIGRAPLSAGVGSWAGGQKDSMRIDVGPTVAAKVNVGPTNLLIQLDWRLRVGGNAAPDNVLALTVATGF
jgi:hypothetical protein